MNLIPRVHKSDLWGPFFYRFRHLDAKSIIHVLPQAASQGRPLLDMAGTNGAGKTTLLKTVSGLLQRQSGSITYDGKHIEEASPPEIVKLGVVHVPEGRKLFPEMTVIDNLLMGASTVPQSERPQRLERVFDIFPVLKERRKQIAGTLSGGEQQMVAIGRGLISGPKLLMLDEPSLGLAPILVEEVFRVITEINRLGVTVLLVEQNTQNALRIAHKGFVMELGRNRSFRFRK